VKDGIMWHRGFTHEQQRALAAGRLTEGDGPHAWDYFLIYQPRFLGGFTVLAVKSKWQIGARYLSDLRP
jgi:hypothetical protein